VELNLIKISLQELIDSGRIHEGKYDQSIAMKQLSKYGSMLEFYVDKETNSSFPLNLVLTNEKYLAPNIPVLKIDFQGNVYLGPDSVILDFSFGVEYILNNDKESWESEPGHSESGWGDIETASPSRSYTKGAQKKVSSSIEYKLK